MKSTEQVRRKLGAQSRQFTSLTTWENQTCHTLPRERRERGMNISGFFSINLSNTGSLINTIKTEQHTDKRKAVGEFKESAEADPLLTSRIRLH